MIAVFRTHSSHGTKQAGTEQCGELRRAALTQGSPPPSAVFFHPTIQEDELCRENGEEQDWEDDLPSHIFQQLRSDQVHKVPALWLAGGILHWLLQKKIV